MPPEPLPWDRKDFVFRDRRHDRGGGPVDALGRGGAGAGPGSFSSPRWREPPPFRGGGGTRDFRAPSPRRPPPGHYKPFASKEPGAHGYPPPPPPPPDEENFRCYSGRYGSSSSGSGGRDATRREGRAHFQRSPPTLNSPRRHHDSPLASASASQRSVVTVTQTPPPASPPSHLLPLKDHQHDDDKAAAPVADAPTTAANTVCDRDRDQDHTLGSIAWKPLKWTRSGSFSSTPAAKTPSRSDHDETAAAEGSALPQGGADNPSRSLLASPTPSDEGQARKKQRLGWGQGLAKYEKKQKVDVPEDSCPGGKNTLVPCTSTSLDFKQPTASDTSSKLVTLPGSASPATPSSINCGSFKGIEDNRVCTTASVDAASNLSDSPCHESQCFPNDFSLDLETLNGDSVIHMSSMLAYLLQPEDTCSGDSRFTRQTSVNKLTSLKSDILKALEKTESEIDTIETDLKSSGSEQDKQLKWQSEEDAIQQSVTDVKAGSSPCSDPINGLDLQSALPSTDSIQKDVSSSQCNDRKEHDIVVNDDIAVQSECVETIDSSNIDLKIELRSSACFDDSKDKVWRVPSILEDDYIFPLISHITSHNNKLAGKASEMFGKELLANSLPEGQFKAVESSLHVKKKIGNRKRCSHIKERVLTLKFRILQHVWKEDLHSRFIKRQQQRSKSQKRGELGLRHTLNGSQKPRTSRLRLSPQGCSSPLPTRDIVDLAGRLLTEPGNKKHVKYSSMPCLILDENERRSSELASNKNGLVEDPLFLEKEKTLINPWADEEKIIFLEKLAAYGKDFKKVASSLTHKTTADCIEFYYKNHKSDSFEPVKKILRLRKQELMEQSSLSNNIMVETGKKWNREVSTSPLDLLGAASVMVARSNSNVRVRPKVPNRPVHGPYVLKTCNDSKTKARSIESHAEAAAVNVLAGIGSTISSEGISCITSSVDPGEKVECPVLSEVTQTIDEETCSDEGSDELESGDWTDGEKSNFITAWRMFGKDFTKISQYLGTRSMQQCKIFFSKARKCLGLDVMLPQGGGNEESPSSDANCGKSELDDVCLAEMDSALCSIQSCSKVGIDLTVSTNKVINRGTTEAVSMSRDTGHGKSNNDFDAGRIREDFDSVAELERSVVSFRNNDAYLQGKLVEVKAAPNEEIVEDDEPPNAPAACKGLSESTDELKANATDHIAEVEQISFARPNLTAPVKHEILHSEHGSDPFSPVVKNEVINSQHENSPIRTAKVKHGVTESWHEDAKNSFDGGIQVKVEPQRLVDAGALKSFDKNVPPSTGVSSISESHLECNGNGVDCLVNNDDGSSRHLLATSLENQIELNLPPLPPMDAEMVPSQKQLSASVSPLGPFGTFPSICLEGHPVDPLFGLNSELSSRSHASCDKATESKTHFINGKQPTVRIDECRTVLGGFSLQFKREKIAGDSDFFSPKSVEVKGMQNKSGSDVHKPLFRKEIGGNDKSGGKNNLANCGMKPSIHFLPTDMLLRPCSQGSQCSEVDDPPVRTGDVKLFGKILSHPPIVQKPEEPEIKPSTSSTLTNDTKHLSFDLGSSRDSRMVLHQTNVDTAHFGLAERPVRSYGFWDGQRIRTGFSSLPETAMLLSKYPEVLSDAAYYENNDNSMEASTTNNCFVRQHPQRTFSVDEKGHNVTAELPKGNGVDGISGLQQPGRVAIRVGGSMLLGGVACTSSGISDPVAALQMHYSMQGELLGGGSSKEDSWKGDVAGR